MADVITRIYSNFRGADFRGDEINLSRSPDLLNVWKDYRETESIRTRPGLALLSAFTEPIYGIFFYKGMTLVHSGSSLYKLTDGATEAIKDGLNEARSYAFVHEDVWYFKDGKHYLQYDGDEIKPVEGYIPTTTIARQPVGSGQKYEDVNMLSPYRKNSFLTDGVSFSYFLDVINVDKDYIPEVTLNDKKVEYTSTENTTETVDEKEEEVTYCKSGDTIVYKVFWADGRIVFGEGEAPDTIFTDGRDNMTVKFKKVVPGYREYIEKCTMLQEFDNRVFFSGNPDRPNYIWHSSLNDPSYVSDLDYYKEGMDNGAVRGMAAGNNALWVFREPSDSNTTVFYHTPAIDEEYGKIYPSSHSSISTGCIGAAVNFNDDIVFFSGRGMEGINGDITTEQVVAHRSTLVDRKLISEDGYNDMILAEWEGYLLVIVKWVNERGEAVGSKVYLADSRAMFQNENHMEYEWFYWELDKVVTCAKVYNGMLYLGCEDGLYTLSDLTKNVESYYTTPKDKFKTPHKLKTTNKRGCVAEATGDISVYAKLEDTEFELIGTYEDVTDYFVSRIKRKKFKDIQLKFFSSTRFSLETVTLECFVGGYIKR